MKNKNLLGHLGKFAFPWTLNRVQVVSSHFSSIKLRLMTTNEGRKIPVVTLFPCKTSSAQATRVMMEKKVRNKFEFSRLEIGNFSAKHSRLRLSFALASFFRFFFFITYLLQSISCLACRTKSNKAFHLVAFGITRVHLENKIKFTNLIGVGIFQCSSE